MKTSCISTLTALCVTTLACGQGFVNLDFEDAVVQPSPPDSIFLDWSLAAPGWESGGLDLYYRQTHLGVSPIHLLMDSTSPVWAPGTQLAGNYSLAFASGYADAGNEPVGPWQKAVITQLGLVPSSSQSIRMLATGPFQVFLGGEEIRMFSLGGNSYGGDVSEFAGDTARLTIHNSAPVGWVHDYTVVDNIQFSPEPIPEPTSGLLLLAGGLLLGAVSRSRKQRPRE